MKKTILIIAVLGFVLPANAEIDPKYKECMQRGYTVDGDFCVFPDGSKCDIEAFNEGTCGQEFMTTDYCIEEGNYVWDNDKCCKGLAPYLPAGIDGQPTCQQKSAVIMKEVTNNYWIWGLVIILTAVYLFMSRKNKRLRKKR